ncbi:TM2 domain-containing protein [Paenactinomyces guangxiensis]|uniref:TM2 domain-containing protein n=2 Tax=Paenactinomyces guangxiensis TaxID=1490290 RepID=A0A7W1WNE6_9BACL|nr:TM2 domain-containing protein [Paenactinomyces guangxiensis]
MSMVSTELEHAKKSMAVGYVLWFFLGEFGAHNFFVGRTGPAVAQLILGLLGWFTIWIFGIGLIFLIPLWIWKLIDAFLLHGWINRQNEEAERRIIQQVLSRRTA